MLIRKHRPVKGRTLKQKNPKILKKLALAFAIVIIAFAAYINLQPHTFEAKQRVKLESTVQQLKTTEKQLQETETQSKAEFDAQQLKLQETQKKLEETEKALQAKRNTPVAYAAELPARTSSGGNCAEWMTAAGIPHTPATDKLILNESGCRTTAVNPSSGACGIPQAYPCSKLPCPLNDSGAVCQLQWMDTYVKGRYGSWDNALSMWYSRCGSPQGCWY